MTRYRNFREKFRIRHSTSTPSKSSNSKKRSKPHIITCTKLILSASVPIMIAIFTVISYVQQMEIAEENRQKDERLANATREKDLEIANLTRLQDQIIANMTRHHDLQLANLTQTKDWEIAMANLEIANQTKIQDRQIAEENRDEDRAQQQDIHYETLYLKYIEDISTVLYKQPFNQSTFTNEEKKMLYIRRKTLITLRSIDSERRSHLFIFLHENNLLPDRLYSNLTVSLVRADLRNIFIESPLTGPYEFNSLILESLNLMNATFIGCKFNGKTNFSGSIMTNIKFIRVHFEDKLTAYEVKLTNASFIDCTFRDIDLKGSDLSHAKFIRSSFKEISLLDSNSTSAVFTDCIFIGATRFFGSEMRSITFENSIFNGNHVHEFAELYLDYSYFSNTTIRNTHFKNSHISYTNFSHSYLYYVQFTIVFFANSYFENSNLTSVDFSQVDLINSKIDLNNSENTLQFYNVILPNGTWLINTDNLVTDGNAEENCMSFTRKKNQLSWTNEIGSPIAYILQAVNSITGHCSFKCKDEKPCSMWQYIVLTSFMLFIERREVPYSISAYFGTDNECVEGKIHISISTYHGTFKREFSNPYIKSSTKSIEWKKHEDVYKLPKIKEDLYYIRVTFDEHSIACYVDNIEFRLRKINEL